MRKKRKGALHEPNLSLEPRISFVICHLVIRHSSFRPYVERSQTVSVSLERAEVAARLGKATNLPRVESGRGPSTRTPLCPPPRSRGRIRGRGATPAEILHSGHVPLPFGRRPACRASRRLHGHGHPRALQAGSGFSRASSDG